MWMRYDSRVSKRDSNFDVTCPCCGAVLKIDSATRGVISHVAPVKPKMFQDMEEAARAMRELLDRHYRRVIAEPLPALGNLPPREAARTVEGREKVIGWLKYLENGEGRRAHREGTPPYDFSWMWRELGVLEERPLRSAATQASCSAPRVPRPPGLNCSTLIRAMKCTPA